MEWKVEWFDLSSRKLGYWKDLKNQKQFLDSVAKHLHIQIPKDWGTVTQDKIIELGGTTLLKQYENSLFKTLEKVYSSMHSNFPNNEQDVHWEREWFVNVPKYSHSFWNNMSNQRLFLYNIASEYGIEDPSQWKRLTYALIKKQGGNVSTVLRFLMTQGLLSRYSNSLHLVLKSVYGANWNTSPTSNTQRRLNAVIFEAQ